MTAPDWDHRTHHGGGARSHGCGGSSRRPSGGLSPNHDPQSKSSKISLPPAPSTSRKIPPLQLNPGWASPPPIQLNAKRKVRPQCGYAEHPSGLPRTSDHQRNSGWIAISNARRSWFDGPRVSGFRPTSLKSVRRPIGRSRQGIGRQDRCATCLTKSPGLCLTAGTTLSARHAVSRDQTQRARHGQHPSQDTAPTAPRQSGGMP